MSHQPERALTPFAAQDKYLEVSRRNESSAREGIDTWMIIGFIFPASSSRNESSAREGIDTWQIICEDAVLSR